mgnify:FL=1
MILALDFETANSDPGSVCAVGLAWFDGTRITGSWESLIRPHRSCRRFSRFNIAVHGITPEMTAHAPEWDEVWPELAPHFAGSMVIAHNAAFDVPVLLRTLELYGFTPPEFDFFCTCKSARRVWPELKNHKLNTISDFLGWKFRHHDAREDAAAAANALGAMLRATGSTDVPELADRLGIAPGRVCAAGFTPCKVRTPQKRRPVQS